METAADKAERTAIGRLKHYQKQEARTQRLGVAYLMRLVFDVIDPNRSIADPVAYLRERYEADENLNNIPLLRWDRMHGLLVRAPRCNWNHAMVDTVCLLKHVARHHVLKVPAPTGSPKDDRKPQVHKEIRGMPAHDYSTINLEVLRRQRLVTLSALNAHNLHLQDDCGNGCYGDPPGYPTYFTRSVYTSRGNNPKAGPELVLPDPENPEHFYDVSLDWAAGSTWETVHAKHKELLRSLYKPLPIEHPRVLGWAKSAAARSRHCYVDPSKGEKKRHVAELVFWPVGNWQLKHFHDDPRFSDEWRAKEKAAVERANAEIIAAARAICVIENHVLLYDLREVYPDVKPTTRLAEGITPQMLIEFPPRQGSDWWERFDSRPTPDKCRPPSWLGAHRTEGWCQFCGWATDEDGNVSDSTALMPDEE